MHGRLPRGPEQREGDLRDIQAAAGRGPREDEGEQRLPAPPDPAGRSAPEEDERDLHGQDRGQPAPDSDPAAQHGLRPRHAKRDKRDPVRPDKPVGHRALQGGDREASALGDRDHPRARERRGRARGGGQGSRFTPRYRELSPLFL